MQPLLHEPDARAASHLGEAQRVLRLPVEASGLRWHPFGVYVAPLARRTVDGVAWVRRLHVWHPAARPVGEASPYGVHTHTGLARSHVLAGALRHHLYDFEPDPDGTWRASALGGEAPHRARLVGHVQATTRAGTTHTLPAHQPHGVSRPPAPGGPSLAVSLFEQVEGPKEEPFRTWQRLDLPEEALVRTPPVPVRRVQAEAEAALERAGAVLAPPRGVAARAGLPQQSF